MPPKMKKKFGDLEFFGENSKQRVKMIKFFKAEKF